MKVMTKNSVFSVLKVGFVTSLLAGLMIMCVDLFKNLDTYTTHQVSGAMIAQLTLLYFPSGILTGMGPSFLFAVSYYLSMLHASNEFICILNSGVNYKKFLVPIEIAAVLVALFYLAFNETVAIRFENIKEAKMQVITSSEDGSADNSNVALSDGDNGLLVYADDYVDSSQSLYNVAVIEKAQNGTLISRTNAFKADWSEENKYWILSDVYVYTPSDNRRDATITKHDTLEYKNFNLEPELFRNLSQEISKMSLPLAYEYLVKIKKANPVQYASLGTEFYKRVLSCLTPLIMMVIACSLNYRFKKNVLFFSLLCSICIAVIYYVIQMITLMLADQGIIRPEFGMIIPFISVILITWMLSLAMGN